MMIQALRRFWLRWTCDHAWSAKVHGELGVTYVTLDCQFCGASRVKKNGL